MSKRAIFIFILIFIIFFMVGFTVQNIMRQNNMGNNGTDGNVVNIIDDKETIEVNSSDEKTTPNTVLILRKKYAKCGHTTSSRATMPEEMVNLTKEEIAEKYPNWEVEEFSKDQIVLLKNADSFCGEHYLLIEEDGNINLYMIDEAGEKRFKRKVDIATQYLPETDRITLRNGLMVYGTDSLNKILEDFEA